MLIKRSHTRLIKADKQDSLLSCLFGAAQLTSTLAGRRLKKIKVSRCFLDCHTTNASVTFKGSESSSLIRIQTVSYRCSARMSVILLMDNQTSPVGKIFLVQLHHDLAIFFHQAGPTSSTVAFLSWAASVVCVFFVVAQSVVQHRNSQILPILRSVDG